MKNTTLIYRQGDVLLTKVESIPERTTKKRDNVVAIGESQNHAHAVFGEVEILEADGKMYLSAKEDFELRHILMEAGVATLSWTKEHTEIKLPAGNYEVTIQQQYNPYLKIIQQVKD